MSPIDPEVPEADALEQAQPVTPEPSAGPQLRHGRGEFEVPEADALDQSREVVLDDEDER
jgi:hypothetical protein